MLVAEFELEEEAAKEKEALNVVKSIVQMQESEGVEEFTFSEVDAEESEGEEEDMMTNKELVRVQNTSKVSPSWAFPLLSCWSHADWYPVQI